MTTTNITRAEFDRRRSLNVHMLLLHKRAPHLSLKGLATLADTDELRDYILDQHAAAMARLEELQS